MHCGCTRRLAAVRRHLASAPHRKYDWSTIRPPPLPLPPLEDTISRYLEQLKPLLSTESHAEAAREAAEFERVLGKDLQQQLKRSVEADRTTSYVKPFWDAMYLGGRYPVVINSNPFVAWHPHPDPTQQSQATRTAGLVHKMLTWRQGMENGLVEPDGPAEPPNRRLCMTEYEKLFCTSRIPVVGGPDVHLTEPSARHIVVLRGAAVYKLNVVRDDGRISSERAIETAMAEILEFPTERDPSAAVATLTAADRDHWGRARTSLLEADPANKVGLNTIESAILHVCLDQTVPTNRKEVYETFLYGGKNGESRWYDKSVSLICTPSGDAAVNFEHSPFDGSTVRFPVGRPALHSQVHLTFVFCNKAHSDDERRLAHGSWPLVWERRAVDGGRGHFVDPEARASGAGHVAGGAWCNPGRQCELWLSQGRFKREPGPL
eukprot:m.146467 g.146467  ORF g.146467 m.146467 type:complete len:434 (+) comp14145_c0_seq4:132-1433(+)